MYSRIGLAAVAVDGAVVACCAPVRYAKPGDSSAAAHSKRKKNLLFRFNILASQL